MRKYPTCYGFYRIRLNTKNSEVGCVEKSSFESMNKVLHLCTTGVPKICMIQLWEASRCSCQCLLSLSLQQGSLICKNFDGIWIHASFCWVMQPAGARWRTVSFLRSGLLAIGGEYVFGFRWFTGWKRSTRVSLLGSNSHSEVL